MKITLYGAGSSRSSRCRWTLLELGADFEYIDDSTLIGTEKLKRIHPLGKLPAIIVDGRSFFESAAICTYLCDLHPENRLIPETGSPERALHDQWCSFALTEIEAYLWNSLKNQKLYPEKKRAPDVIPNNTEEIRAGLSAVEATLKTVPYLTGADFSVTDIIVGFAINWAKNAGHLENFPNLSDYLKKLHHREHCPLKSS